MTHCESLSVQDAVDNDVYVQDVSVCVCICVFVCVRVCALSRFLCANSNFRIPNGPVRPGK
jgi:hypothetical protein